MGLFGIFGKNNKYGGIVKDLNIGNFYIQLSDTEKQMMRDVLEPEFYVGTNPYKKNDLDTGNAKWDKSLTAFFLNMGKGVTDKNFSIKLYEEGLKYNDTDYVAQHLITQDLAEKYYQLKEFDKCEVYCKKDISEIEKYMNDRIYKGNPNVYSFKRLAILYEKQEKFNEAIEVCKLAIKKKQHDGTKNGYEGRIEKLQRKLSK